MDFILSENVKLRYSKGERSLFATLPRNGKQVTTAVMAVRLHGRGNPMGRIRVIGTLRSLIRKINENDEMFRIKRERRSGPHPIRVWLEAR